jgi:hypothetical protein
MNNLGREEGKCAAFLEELERVPGGATGTMMNGEWTGQLSADGREHARACAGCGAALQDFAETRRLLANGMTATVAEPGPWFSARVMAAIAARENEIEERAEGFWSNVRRMAPRMVAASMLLVALGGTWALEERRSELRRNEVRSEAGARSQEAIFEAGQSTPLNDDILANANESAR